MKIYIVQENIDLGYHTKSVWFSKELADAECLKRTEKGIAENPYRSNFVDFFVEEFETSDERI